MYYVKVITSSETIDIMQNNLLYSTQLSQKKNTVIYEIFLFTVLKVQI